MSNHLLLMSITLLILTQSTAHSQRLTCEHRERSNVEYTLNCTWLSTQSPDGTMTNSKSPSDSSSFIQLGMDPEWRTPWQYQSIPLEAVDTLNLRHSRLNRVGTYLLRDFPKVQYLDLSHNSLTNLSAETFSNLYQNLIKLDLSHNAFESVPDLISVVQLRNVQILKLSDNRLTSIPYRQFHNMTKLTHLDLSNSLIKTIDAHAFVSLPQLEFLQLNSNHLRQLPESVFKDLTLKYVHLHDNLFQCDCNLRWLIPYLKSIEYNMQTQMDMQILNSNQRLTDAQRASIASGSNQRLANAQIASLNALKCEQPNSLKSLKTPFVDMNPDSFMCDVSVSRLTIEGMTTERVDFDLGEEAVFMCEVYGDPEPNIYWAFGDRFIEKSLNEDKYIINDGRTSNKTSRLRVLNLQPADVGLYKCVGEIGGSTNRKEVAFRIKSVVSHGAALSIASVIFNVKSVSNWTLALLVAIAIAICVFTLLLISFVCIRCKRMKAKSAIYMDKGKGASSVPRNGPGDDEERRDLVDCNAAKNDTNECIYGNVNSIRHAPKKYQPGDYFNESNSIYATNNTETLLLNNSSASTLMTPRYHQQNGQIYAHVAPTHMAPDGSLCYYDDLKTSQYDESSEAGLLPNHHEVNYAQQNRVASLALYSSPMRHVVANGSYTAVGGVPPHYATVKPKMQHVVSGVSSAGNYVPYSTIYRQVGSPGHQIYAQYASVQQQQQQPHVQIYANPYQMISSQPKLIHPVQVAVPIPPAKPKRTFEHQVGAAASSATSLDEDLDLNDLKDFEDVTFDNLRKPGAASKAAKEAKETLALESGSSTLNSNPTQMTTTTNTLGSTSSSSTSSSTTDRSTKSLLQIKTPEPQEVIVDVKKAAEVPDEEKVYEETEI